MAGDGGDRELPESYGNRQCGAGIGGMHVLARTRICVHICTHERRPEIHPEMGPAEFY